MANKISEIPVLEKLLKERHIEVDGIKIEIGHFWSVLQIYLCMKTLNISLGTLCKVASLVTGRVDSKNKPDESEINSMSIRRCLNLEGSTSQISHTVVTKTVSSGLHPETLDSIKEALMKHCSYGPDLMEEIKQISESQKNKLIETKFSVMGNSGFATVLKISLILLELYKSKKIHDMGEMNPSDHVSHIIKTIKENKSNAATDTIGFSL